MKTVRIDNRTWDLPDALFFNDGYYFYDIIDFRRAMAGEWYISGSNPRAYMSILNTKSEYLIAERGKRVRGTTIWVEEE